MSAADPTGAARSRRYRERCREREAAENLVTTAVAFAIDDVDPIVLEIFAEQQHIADHWAEKHEAARARRTADR